MQGPASSSGGFEELPAASGSSGFSEAKDPMQFEFPRDHGPHSTFRLEWWYVTSVLETSTGREFGVQFTLFRLATTPVPASDSPWRSGQLFTGHFAVSDIAAKKHYEAQRSSRGHPDLAAVVAQPFSAFIDGWSLHSVGREFAPLKFKANDRGISVDLTFDMGKPIFLHGVGGLSQKTPDNFSYYYSVPRMKAFGNVSIDDRAYEVSGTGWMDREWSSGFLSDPYVGWDWFALQLDDGRDLVLFQIRSESAFTPLERAGVVIAEDGEGSYLRSEEWELVPARTWKGYPVQWNLRVQEMSATITAAFDEQHMDTSLEYWEGVVYVDSSQRRLGKGYMELVGY